ncbi:MAG: T9SS type A sorting domain-containing protein [Flammeovirgaceae bacterium]
MKNQRIFATAFVLSFLLAFQSMATVKGGGGKSADAKFAYSLRTVQNTDKIVLAFDNLLKKKVTISIYNAANQLVFKETQDATLELRKGYDLSNLKDGKYTVKIESDNFSFKEEVEIGKDWNPFGFEAVIARDPIQDNKLRIGFSNATGDVLIEIADVRGNVVHSEYYDAQYGNQLFNMAKLGKGEYNVSVFNGSESVTEKFIVE